MSFPLQFLAFLGIVRIDERRRLFSFPPLPLREDDDLARVVRAAQGELLNAGYQYDFSRKD